MNSFIFCLYPVLDHHLVTEEDQDLVHVLQIAGDQTDLAAVVLDNYYV